MTDVHEIAAAILEGFNRHYRLFREISTAAQARFENADWEGCATANRERIQMYDLRVHETVSTIIKRFPQAETDESLWPNIKLAYVGLLYEHLRPELAETFFNSVACRVLHRWYYHNRYIFWRPATSTVLIEGNEPTYRCYYPNQKGTRKALLGCIAEFGLTSPFANLKHDVRCLEAALDGYFPSASEIRPNYQIQILGSLFYRNKAAYIVGRALNAGDVLPFAIPILQNSRDELFLDTIITSQALLLTLFSFNRAYFMVDMDVPSAYVSFLMSVLPGKPEFEIYNMLGLQKQGKTMFYREMHHHLRYSSDNFVIAPGIRGMVMLVFTLPSFPYVFKIIRDHFEPPKEANRQEVKDKYLLVKYHDRVGRLADTLEYSQVEFPLDRISEQLLAELRNQAASNIEVTDDELVVKHLYIERRMVPLNEYLNQVDAEKKRSAINEYGKAIRELAGANIFPGDMMLKNFGVTSGRRVVFYDYDEICYMTDCNFRRIPPPTSIDDEMMSQPTFSVGPSDVFPEQFSNFFFSDQDSRNEFYRHHQELVSPKFWRDKKERILAGHHDDILPYPPEQRFSVLYPNPRSLLPRKSVAARE
jgi:isocitrate dehydrogenase kinase/phosphatase